MQDCKNIYWFFISLKLSLIIIYLVNETVSQSVSCPFKRSQKINIMEWTALVLFFFWFSERGERRWDVRNDILCSDGASWILPPSLITPWPLSLQSLPGQQLLEEGEEGRYHKIISDNQHLIYKWKIKKFSPTPPI